MVWANLAAGAMVLAGLVAPTQAAITFDTAADFALFNHNGDSDTTFTWSATAGVGGGGGVVSDSTDIAGSAFIYPTPFLNDLGPVGKVSIDYQFVPDNFPDFRVGFA